MPNMYIWSTMLFFFTVFISSETMANAYPGKESDEQYIRDHYAEQLTSPEKKERKNFAQFGYGLSYFPFPLFPITGFIDPNDFGEHSYSKPSLKEKNGALYTCRGGFIDFSHMRAAMDWTTYVAFHIICGEKDMDLPSSDGKLKLHLKNINSLSLEDIVGISQKVSFERLVWHEVCSWHYHQPNYMFNEQQSTFTPEDNYSNFLGTVIGRNIVIRILKKREGLTFEQIATEEIQKYIATLLPVSTKKQSMEAYDIVDADKQSKLPAAKRNKDVWWDSKVVFTDERYVFKRYIAIGPKLSPWLVPLSNTIGCKNIKPEVLLVPQKTKSGSSLNNYYTLIVEPDSLMFYDKKNNKQLHKPFGSFTSKNMQKIITHVSKEMQEDLLSGFSKRNKINPEGQYTKLKKVWFKLK